jgi:putative flippase GtrA
VIIPVAAGAIAGMFANFFASRRLVFRAKPQP